MNEAAKILQLLREGKTIREIEQVGISRGQIGRMVMIVNSLKRNDLSVEEKAYNQTLIDRACSGELKITQANTLYMQTKSYRPRPKPEKQEKIQPRKPVTQPVNNGTALHGAINGLAGCITAIERHYRESDIDELTLRRVMEYRRTLEKAIKHWKAQSNDASI